VGVLRALVRAHTDGAVVINWCLFISQMEIKVLNSQSLLDIAIQEGGSVEAVFDLALAAGLGITADMPAGTLLAAPAVVSRQVADYYRTNSIRPATALSAQDAEFVREGIRYWRVEYDFAVS
jgi:hypothetical protein